MEPKLYDDLKYGGECPLCGEMVEKGSVGWVYDRKAWCSTHRKTDIMNAVSVNTGALREQGVPAIYPNYERCILDGFSAVVAAIEANTRTLQCVHANLEVIAGRLQK